MSHTSVRSRAQPLTTRGRDGVLRGEIDGLSQESEEGMWYGPRVSRLLERSHGCPRNCKRRAPANATEVRPH
jgi:hypothetical protein